MCRLSLKNADRTGLVRSAVAGVLLTVGGGIEVLGAIVLPGLWVPVMMAVAGVLVAAVGVCVVYACILEGDRRGGHRLDRVSSQLDL